jgi:hypothetical protein
MFKKEEKLVCSVGTRKPLSEPLTAWGLVDPSAAVMPSSGDDWLLRIGLQV